MPFFKIRLEGIDIAAIYDFGWEIVPQGHGLVTNKPFLKGDFLLEYRGILSIADDQDDENADYVFHFSHKSTEYRIDASDSNSCLARWVNDDHVHPNSIMKKVAFDNKSPHLCLFALVDLKEGVELTYDYGVKNLPWRQPSLEKEKNIPSCKIPKTTECGRSGSILLPHPSLSPLFSLQKFVKTITTLMEIFKKMTPLM
ncbi:histone-lysine N-methyltransferase PR-Set7-like [Strongylocentrotus purpuratus]|uniref:SET domain-containing protein n=1 Tax=Strongylocentrotus purpuratus TaxID=7668 RepID=A0A7M7T0F4_STRPU|nr:histone-lysine N-methyltransferase PR-Set7-like [Strongylocentrotus purpuratus]